MREHNKIKKNTRCNLNEGTKTFAQFYFAEYLNYNFASTELKYKIKRKKYYFNVEKNYNLHLKPC